MDEGRYAGTIAILAILTVVCWVCVVARFYTRRCVERYVDAGDWMLLLALFVVTIFAAFFWAAVKEGFGQHTSAMPKENAWEATHMLFFADLAYAASTVLTRTTIGLLVLRHTKNTAIRLATIIPLILAVLYGLALLFVTIFQCRPVSYNWNKEGKQGTCMDESSTVAINYFNGAMSLTIDGIFVVIAISSILRMGAQRKAIACAWAAIGFGICAVGLDLARFGFTAILAGGDTLFDRYPLTLISYLEMTVLLLASALGGLRPLFVGSAAQSKVFPIMEASEAILEDPAMLKSVVQASARPVMSRGATARSIEEWNMICSQSHTSTASSPTPCQQDAGIAPWTQAEKWPSGKGHLRLDMSMLQ